MSSVEDQALTSNPPARGDSAAASARPPATAESSEPLTGPPGPQGIPDTPSHQPSECAAAGAAPDGAAGCPPASYGVRVLNADEELVLVHPVGPSAVEAVRTLDRYRRDLASSELFDGMGVELVRWHGSRCQVTERWLLGWVDGRPEWTADPAELSGTTVAELELRAWADSRPAHHLSVSELDDGRAHIRCGTTAGWAGGGVHIIADVIADTRAEAARQCHIALRLGGWWS